MSMNPNIPFSAAASRGLLADHATPAYLRLSTAQLVLLVLGTVLFDQLFWTGKPGVNLTLYTLFVVAAQLYLLPAQAAARRSGYFWLMVGGSVVSAAAMGVYGSFVAALACLGSVAALLGYVNQPHLKLLPYAVLTAVGSGLQAGLRLLAGVRPPRHAGVRVRRSWFYARLLLVPLVVLGAFHVLFAVANPVYDKLSSRVLVALGEWLALLLPAISVPRVVFFVFGFFVTAGTLVLVPVYLLVDHESRFGEFIRRQRDRVASLAVRRPDFGAKTFRSLDLRKEYYAAVAVFGLVNILLLVVNAIDINWLWFGFVPEPGFDLAQFVHEGTYVLILSILLAMGIVLWFFRRNLNFYAAGLPVLRWGATVWVLQNVVLAVSVGLRNYYYIVNSGLAYKRIGVCFFLLLTLYGLVTVLLKIWQLRSAYSLVRLNALAVYAVVLALAVGNWEVWMARYNLQPRFRSIDIGFLLDMPGRVLPTVMARRDVLNHARLLTVEGEYRRHDNSTAYGPHAVTRTEAQQRLNDKVRAWLSGYEHHATWQGTTWTDWQTRRELEQQLKRAKPVKLAAATAR